MENHQDEFGLILWELYRSFNDIKRYVENLNEIDHEKRTCLLDQLNEIKYWIEKITTE